MGFNARALDVKVTYVPNIYNFRTAKWPNRMNFRGPKQVGLVNSQNSSDRCQTGKIGFSKTFGVWTEESLVNSVCWLLSYENQQIAPKTSV